jgi:hypothetical protein
MSSFTMAAHSTASPILRRLRMIRVSAAARLTSCSVMAETSTGSKSWKTSPKAAHRDSMVGQFRPA